MERWCAVSSSSDQGRLVSLSDRHCHALRRARSPCQAPPHFHSRHRPLDRLNLGCTIAYRESPRVACPRRAFRRCVFSFTSGWTTLDRQPRHGQLHRLLTLYGLSFSVLFLGSSLSISSTLSSARGGVGRCTRASSHTWEHWPPVRLKRVHEGGQ